MPDRSPEAPLHRRHPLFVGGVSALVVLLLVATGVVLWRGWRYHREEAYYSARLSADERALRDRILEARSRHAALGLALLRRELRIRSAERRQLHLALSLDSGYLDLRHGPVTVRRARIQVGPDTVVRTPDGRIWRLVRPLGERRIARKLREPTIELPPWVYVLRGQPIPPPEARRVPGGLGRYVLLLDDGTEIYSPPRQGPLQGWVKPGGILVPEADLAAIFDAVSEDVPVYIY